MLTWESSKIVGYEGGVAVELRRGHCLSTDTKPTGPSIGNGSYLREMDTGDEYEYDAQNDIWRAGSGGGGGAGLPAVTSEDNGDVLTVVDGAWDKAAPSGGGSDIFVAHFEVTLDEDTQSAVVTCDKTPAEIVAAGDAGKLVIAKALMWETYPEEASIKLVAEMQGSDPYINIEFLGIYYDSASQASSNDRLSRAKISWDAGNNRWLAEGANYQLTPAT